MKLEKYKKKKKMRVSDVAVGDICLNTSAFGYVLLRKCHHLGTHFVLMCRLSNETEKVNISLSGTLFLFSRVIIYMINLYKFKLNFG